MTTLADGCDNKPLKGGRPVWLGPQAGHFDFTTVSISMLDDDRIGGTEIAVFTSLARYANTSTGICKPAITTIAGKLHYSRNTVSTAIGHLADYGYVKQVGDGSKGRTSNTYQLLTPPSMTVAAVPVDTETNDGSDDGSNRAKYARLEPQPRKRLPVNRAKYALELEPLLEPSVCLSTEPVTTETTTDEGIAKKAERVLGELGAQDHADALRDGVPVRNKIGHLNACIQKRRDTMTERVTDWLNNHTSASHADAVIAMGGNHPDDPDGAKARKAEADGKAHREALAQAERDREAETPVVVADAATRRAARYGKHLSVVPLEPVAPSKGLAAAN